METSIGKLTYEQVVARGEEVCNNHANLLTLVRYYKGLKLPSEEEMLDEQYNPYSIIIPQATFLAKVRGLWSLTSLEEKRAVVSFSTDSLDTQFAETLLALIESDTLETRQALTPQVEVIRKHVGETCEAVDVLLEGAKEE